MKIVAQKTNSPVFLVAIDENDEGPQAMGMVVEMGKGSALVHDPFNIHSILARGYWENPTVSDEEQAQLLALVENDLRATLRKNSND